MIRAGREVVDTDGIAALLGMTPVSARRQKPWDKPGHPAPVNTARPGPGGRKRLWDHAQVVAYIAGEPIPAIPDRDDTSADDERDLLDATEVATLRDATLARFREQVRDGYLVGPDEQPCGVPHWRRATARTMRSGPGAGVSRRPDEGRPAGPARDEIHQRLADALGEFTRTDGSVNVAALSRAAGVSRVTAQRFVDRLAAE